MIENLALFNKNYFDLIDKTIPINKELDNLSFKNIANQDFDLRENFIKTSQIFNSLVLPFNFLTMINLISNLPPWIKSPSEIEVIHRKFAIFNNFLQKILSKLFISFSHDKEPDQEGAKKVMLQLFWQNFAFNSEKILDYLTIFEDLKLSEEAEKVLDSLWIIDKPAISSLDFLYEENQDWRDIIIKFHNNEYPPKTIKR